MAQRNPFPFRTSENCRVTSPEDIRYNCFAWAAGDATRWWEPRGYWPRGAPRDYTLEAFIRAFEALGYTACFDGRLEQGFEKVVLYGDSHGPKHAARQLLNGRWTSKLGKDIDVEHELHALVGPAYGAVLRYMKRPQR